MSTFLYFFTRHVSDKDRQSKLYRNVQPVFSIDDEDEDGGIDRTVWCNWFESECMKCSGRRATANWVSITQQMVVTLEGKTTNNKEFSYQYSPEKNHNSLWKEHVLPKPILTNQTVIENRNIFLCVFLVAKEGIRSTNLLLFILAINLAFVKLIVSINTV